MIRLALVFLAFAIAMVPSQNAAATERKTPGELLEEFDLPFTRLKVLQAFRMEEYSQLSELTSTDQISCARKQLAEYQKAVSFIHGGKSAVDRSFTQYHVKTRIVLTDDSAKKRMQAAEVDLNLDSLPAGADERPFSLFIGVRLGVDSSENIVCDVATANQIAKALVSDERLGLRIQPSPTTSSMEDAQGHE
jgi:hypothetical protein